MERAGLLASSNAHRLKPEGVDHSGEVDRMHLPRQFLARASCFGLTRDRAKAAPDLPYCTDCVRRYRYV